MTISIDDATRIFQDAVREAVERQSFWYLVQAGLMAAAGILALVFPIFSSFSVVFMLGWLLIFSGVSQGFSLFGARHAPHFWMQLISVVLAILVGFLFLTRPGEGLITLTLFLILFFMVEGVAKISFSLMVRPLPNWGWVMASGVVGVLLSGYLLLNAQLTAMWLLGLLLGINLITQGAALGYFAWQVRHPSDAKGTGSAS